MSVDQFFTASFSGYRPEKYNFPLLDENNIAYLRHQAAIQKAIVSALHHGYRFFLCGMSRGFDLLCADILLDIKEQNELYRNISLTAVLPFAAHGFRGAWGELHRIIKHSANQVVIVSPEYTPACYAQRNRYLVQNSSYLICYWDGKEGGTAQTVRMAQKAGMTIHNTASGHI